MTSSFTPKTFILFNSASKYVALSARDEDYSRNASRALNFISSFLLEPNKTINVFQSNMAKTHPYFVFQQCEVVMVTFVTT